MVISESETGSRTETHFPSAPLIRRNHHHYLESHVLLPLVTVLSVQTHRTMLEMAHCFSLRSIILVQETSPTHSELRIHFFQIDTHPSQGTHPFHLAAFPVNRHGTETRYTGLRIQCQPRIYGKHPFHVQTVAFHAKQSTAYFQEMFPLPVPFLAEYSHVQTYFFITVTVIVINGDNDLSRKLPPITHIPLHTGSQVHQRFIHLVVEKITIM